MRTCFVALGLCAMGLSLLGGSGCSGTTGVALSVGGADSLGGDRLEVTGTIDGEAMHMGTVPSKPRALGADEGLRIVLPDSYAGKRLDLDVSVLKNGAPVGEVGHGSALLVLDKTKRVCVCFTDDNCPALVECH